MSKRTVFTTVTPLPPGITRETVMETLHDHFLMIDLNPLVEERHPIKPPADATPEEFHCQWYSLTDRVQYLPGGMASGKVTYNACMHDLANGLQTHIYAPLGLNIRGKWTLGGSLPGEPVAPIELGMGVPLTGLWIREDVDMRCNFMLTSFVKGNIKKSHATLVERLVSKAKAVESLRGEDDRMGRGFGEEGDEEWRSREESRSRVEAWAANTHAGLPSPTESRTSTYQVSEFSTEDDSLRPRPLSIVSNRTNQSGSRTGAQPWQNLQPASRMQQQRTFAEHVRHRSRSPAELPQADHRETAELPQVDHYEKKMYEMA